MRTAKGFRTSLWVGEGVHVVLRIDREDRVELDLIVARRGGDAERPDLEKDIASVLRELDGVAEELDDGTDIHVRLGPGTGPGDLEGPEVSLAGAQAVAAAVRVDCRRNVLDPEADDHDAVHLRERDLTRVRERQDRD